MTYPSIVNYLKDSFKKALIEYCRSFRNYEFPKGTPNEKIFILDSDTGESYSNFDKIELEDDHLYMDQYEMKLILTDKCNINICPTKGSINLTTRYMDLIDSISSYYGVDFPGSDIFYPDFVDNILATSNNLVYLGMGLIEDTECYHVAGATDDITFQFWINAQPPGLPVKMSIDYIDKPESPRYTIRFSDWKLNEDISDSVFEFTALEGAKKIKLIK